MPPIPKVINPLQGFPSQRVHRWYEAGLEVPLCGYKALCGVMCRICSAPLIKTFIFSFCGPVAEICSLYSIPFTTSATFAANQSMQWNFRNGGLKLKPATSLTVDASGGGNICFFVQGAESRKSKREARVPKMRTSGG